jgi:hypothetical protein
MQNAGSNLITSEESLAVAAVFGLSGLTNVLLFLFIRPNLLLFQRDNCCDRCSKMASPIPTSPMPKSVQPTESVEMGPVVAGVQVEPRTHTVD